MTIESAILKNIENLPESVKEAVFIYTEFLAHQYRKQSLEQTKQDSEDRQTVSIEGAFKLPLPADFDRPIESMDAEKKALLEKKYGYGSLAGKITMSDDFDEPLEDLKDYM
jgi:hypothetical protein